MLVAEGLRKRYKSREVVRDFGLTLNAGEVVGLLGPNGAGKTTCFYMIVGLVAADAGTIELDGQDITAQPMYQRAVARWQRYENMLAPVCALLTDDPAYAPANDNGRVMLPGRYASSRSTESQIFQPQGE